jgi:hypothetical protein
MAEEAAQRRKMDPVQFAAFVTKCGEYAKSGCPPKLPPRGSTARLVILAGRKARGEKVDDEY